MVVIGLRGLVTLGNSSPLLESSTRSLGSILLGILQSCQKSVEFKNTLEDNRGYLVDRGILNPPRFSAPPEGVKVDLGGSASSLILIPVDFLPTTFISLLGGP
jgi:hypothetical protein